MANFRKFEKVSRVKDLEFNLPRRKTKHSAGYDFECIETVTIPPYKLGDKPFLIPTGVKCLMVEDEFLMLVNRSSNPGKKNLVIPNSMGIIDADFYNNPDNEGEMMFAYYNLGTEPITIEKGYCMGQGIFQKYLTTIDDNTETERVGGFGSTNN
jgi:dUTP pyrophosphatase